MDFAETWQAALGELELTLSKANFTTWFKNTYISAMDNERVVICVPNTFTKAWLEKKYHDSIIKALRSVGSNSIREVTYKVEVRNTTPIPGYDQETGLINQADNFSNENQADEGSASGQKNDSCFNPRYTFDNFVVGKTNELAHAASMAVATKPGATYNPLFVYGGSGLGKTHLLHAIGSYLKSVSPKLKAIYVTCETFTNEFIQAVKGGRINSFKDTYRNADLLLVDDIQFISGKEGTQEEFFHTFNALHQSDKQIVITADRSPKDIQALEARLLSRFEWGMIADISCPDFETRVAILDSKLKAKSTPLPREIMNYIAGTIQSNIRELEGALNKILAYHQFKNTAPTMESVQCLLQSYLPTIPKRTITPKRLLEIVTGYFDVSHEDLLGQCREQRLAFPRQVAMYLLRHEAKCSYPHIGNHLGGRDHTTAMHACSKIEGLIKTDEQLKRDLSLIREKLYSTT